MQSKVSPTMTKKEIIEKYNLLLTEFEQQAAARKESADRLTAQEKKKASEALDTGLQITVDSALEGVSRLRALVGTTLNNLSDQMAAQAEKLTQLNQAITLQRARLKELYDIEYAADTISKLSALYADERTKMELEYAARLSDLEASYAQRSEELAKSFSDQEAELKQIITATQSQWKIEEEERIKNRARERAEYEYDRDRARRLEKDEDAEQRAALEKELRLLREEAERDISTREAAICAREEEIERMSSEVEEFPARLEAAILQAQERTAAEVRKEMEQQAALVAVERNWERKSQEQTIRHLQDTNKSLEKKIQDLSTELREAHQQINVIAAKAVEGTSISKAFASMNQITREQTAV
ncbi:hypothetical protein LM599_02200 [Candidatus Acetothermia bacterium]|jgi:hypothetical protein|nr:hypothetical protein [Candidatus Acetothermia bacterium]MCI2428524.1 hypothetical protein [Candidatus Acetothermia bacterium]